MKKTLAILALLLSVVSLHAQSVSTPAPAPTWIKVATEGDVITTLKPVSVRFGSGTCWSASFNATFTNFVSQYSNFLASFNIPDPCVSVTKEVDVAETNVPQTITVNNLPVIVPALVVATPPPVTPPVVTPPVPPVTTPPVVASTPVPVVLNGTKYSCTSITLDNSGTLTLICTK